MSNLSRQSAFVVQQNLTPAVVNPEFDNIVNTWNGHNTGLLTWDTIAVTSFTATGLTLGNMIVGVRVVTAAGAVTVANTDYCVVVNKTVGAATVVNLPASPTTGRVFVIKDGKGDANTNNLTLTPAAGNLDGATTFVINTAYGAVTIIYNGTQWNVLWEGRL